MTGGDKILSRIKSDCDEEIRKAEAESDKACKAIIAKGKDDADRAAAEIVKKAEAKAKQIKEISKSRAELEIRSSLLKRRRSEIDLTVSAVLEYLLVLDNKAYFEIIYSLAKKLEGKSGKIFFNEKDLSRLPDNFEKQMKKIGVDAEVNKKAVDIDGGFILKSGDIEENMSFSAIIADKRDELEDLINRELFAE